MTIPVNGGHDRIVFVDVKSDVRVQAKDVEIE